MFTQAHSLSVNIKLDQILYYLKSNTINNVARTNTHESEVPNPTEVWSLQGVAK